MPEPLEALALLSISVPFYSVCKEGFYGPVPSFVVVKGCLQARDDASIPRPSVRAITSRLFVLPHIASCLLAGGSDPSTYYFIVPLL